MIEPKKIRKGDVVATKHQSIIVENEGEGENLALYGKICNKYGCPSGKTSIPPTHLRLRNFPSYTRSECHNETKRLKYEKNHLLSTTNTA